MMAGACIAGQPQALDAVGASRTRKPSASSCPRSSCWMIGSSSTTSTVAGRSWASRRTSSRRRLAASRGARLRGRIAALSSTPASAHRELRAAAEHAGRPRRCRRAAAQLAHDGEAEAGPADLARARAVDLPELLEDEPELIGRDADAGVLDGDHERRCPRPHRPAISPVSVNLAAFDSRFSRICRSLSASVEVARVDGDVEPEHDVLALEVLAHGGGALLDERLHLDVLVDHIDVAGLDLGEVEDVVDEREQRLRVRLDDVQVAPAVGREAAPSSRMSRSQ